MEQPSKIEKASIYKACRGAALGSVPSEILQTHALLVQNITQQMVDVLIDDAIGIFGAKGTVAEQLNSIFDEAVKSTSDFMDIRDGDPHNFQRTMNSAKKPLFEAIQDAFAPYRERIREALAANARINRQTDANIAR